MTKAVRLGLTLTCALTVYPAVAAGQRGGGPPLQSSQLATASEATSAISGVVIDGETQRPIAGVMVYLGFQGKGPVGRLSRQISDEKGRFVFVDLPAGSLYFINAAKPGYIEGHYGTGAGGQLGGLITVGEGQWFAKANVVMHRPASIAGTVRDESGEPVVGAYVRVLARIPAGGAWHLATGQTAQTDDRGVYRLSDLIPGKYVVQVVSVQQSFPATATPELLSGFTADQLARGRTLPDPPAALDPVSGSRLVVGNFQQPTATSTGRAYAPVFFPNAATLSGAATIEVKAAESRAGVDLSLVVVPVVSVSGVVTGPQEALRGQIVRLLPEGLESLGQGSEVAGTLLDGDGRFTLFNVPVGAYTLVVGRNMAELQYRPSLGNLPVSLPGPPGQEAMAWSSGSVISGPSGAQYSSRSLPRSSALYARERIVVDDKPLTDLSVTLRRGASIRGRIVTANGEPPYTGARPMINVYAEPANGDMSVGMLSSNAPIAETFEIEGLQPGAYVLRLPEIDGKSVRSITANGEEVGRKAIDVAAGRDVDVVVTLIDKKVTLSGFVTDDKGQRVAGAVVLAFPIERELWTNFGLVPIRIKAYPVAAAATYKFQSLPAGEYFLIALPTDDADLWKEPGSLERLAPLSQRVRLEWGDTKTQDLRMVKRQ